MIRRHSHLCPGRFKKYLAAVRMCWLELPPKALRYGRSPHLPSTTQVKAEYIRADRLSWFVFRLQLCGLSH